MVDPLVLGVALFGLLIAPFGAYVLLTGYAGSERSSSERPVPSSTTQNAPSRTIPGSKGRGGDRAE